MAEIIDVLKDNRIRFAAWAREWLNMPPEMFVGGVIREQYMQTVIEFFLEQRVFTIDDLRAEFTKHKIYISESVIKKALKGADNERR